MSTIKNHADLIEGRNYQLPNQLLNEAFGELNITRQANRLEVVVTVLVDPSQSSAGENWQTGVALDGSSSMRGPYGSDYEFTREITASMIQDFESRGIAERRVRDGHEVLEFNGDGYTTIEKEGLLRRHKNEVQEISREAIPYLAEKLDEDGGTTLIYWACGETGDQIEVVGDLTGSEARVAEYLGPKNWGGGTRLMPAIRYFLDRFQDAKMGFYVFVTDGAIDDFEEVKTFTAQLSRDLDAKRCNDVKLILIGVGPHINRKQLEELDDLPDELDLPVDVWDHKIANEMRGLSDIFAELVDENMILAPSGKILDDSNQVAKEFPDGLPALIQFSLPLEAREFSLEIAGGNIVSQQLYESSSPPPLP